MKHRRNTVVPGGKTRMAADLDPERDARLDALAGPTCRCGHRAIVHGKTGCLASILRGKAATACPCKRMEAAA